VYPAAVVHRQLAQIHHLSAGVSSTNKIPEVCQPFPKQLCLGHTLTDHLATIRTVELA